MRRASIGLIVVAATLSAAGAAHAQQITEYQLSDDSNPRRIAAGPDGAL